MDPSIDFILILLPVVLASILLNFFHRAADTIGAIVWVITLLIAAIASQTPSLVR